MATVLAVLLVVGVAIAARNRSLRARPGNVRVRARFEPSGAWIPGHAVWVDDVFAFRRSPAAWEEVLLVVTNASVWPATDEERGQLARMGPAPVVATFTLASGGSVAFAARAEDRPRLLGPYG
jgi:hypothetical protein